MVIQDIPRLYTAIAEWMGVMATCFILLGIPRSVKFWISSVIFLIFQSVFLVTTENVPIPLWLPCMAFAVFSMFLFIYLSCRVSIMTAGFFCASVFLVAEFAASLNWQITYFIFGSSFSYDGWNVTDRSRGLFIASFVLMLVTYLLVYISVLCAFRNLITKNYQREISWQEFVEAGLTALFIFAFSNISFILPNTPFSGKGAADIFNIRTIIDLGGLVTLYAQQTRIQQLRAETELAQLNAVLNSQYEQYRNYQDGIEMINIKYHDLKHQLTALRAEMDPEKRAEWLDRLEEEIRYYRPEKETGNPVLNVLIAGKTPAMRNLHIQFTCVADGQLLSFLHVTDICSIFGNALDNAIENVALVGNPDKRLIHLQINERKGFLFIMMSNYCETRVEFSDGLPVTSKTDMKNHGFGVRSIKRAVEKYGGSVIWTQKHDEFDMKILIPLPA